MIFLNEQNEKIDELRVGEGEESLDEIETGQPQELRPITFYQRHQDGDLLITVGLIDLQPPLKGWDELGQLVLGVEAPEVRVEERLPPALPDQILKPEEQQSGGKGCRALWTGIVINLFQQICIQRLSICQAIERPGSED